jgi:hypothetical protein
MRDQSRRNSLVPESLQVSKSQEHPRRPYARHPPRDDAATVHLNAEHPDTRRRGLSGWVSRMALTRLFVAGFIVAGVRDGPGQTRHHHRF